jgi:hypothetical protein
MAGGLPQTEIIRTAGSSWYQDRWTHARNVGYCRFMRRAGEEMLMEVGLTDFATKLKAGAGDLRHSVAHVPPETQSPDSESCNRNVLTFEPMHGHPQSDGRGTNKV